MFWPPLVPKPMFRDEPEEKPHTARRQKQQPFAQEAEESLPRKRFNSSSFQMLPFQDEDEEPLPDREHVVDDSSASSSGDEAVTNPNNGHAVVSLGWAALGAWSAARAGHMEKEHAVQSESSSNKRPYNSDRRKAVAKDNHVVKSTRRSHADNAVDPKRIAELAKRDTCMCTRKQCFRMFALSELRKFLDTYWAGPKSERDSLLATAIHTDKKGERQLTWTFLGEQLSPKCLATLLGHGRRKLYAALDGRVDMRMHVKQRGLQTCRQSSVDAFLLTQYLSVAETLPTGLATQLVFQSSVV